MNLNMKSFFEKQNLKRDLLITLLLSINNNKKEKVKY
jgi:hypothetical protein